MLQSFERWNLCVFFGFSRPDYIGLGEFLGLLEGLVAPGAGDDIIDGVGGGTEVEKKNVKKAEVLYNTIDGSNGFYKCPVEKSVRSLMNVPFTLEKPELEGEFIKEAAKENMVQLKGHRSVGGMRASIYNAMPLAGVQKLVAFMKDFQARHA